MCTSRKDSEEFAKIVRKKIDGWYQKDEHYSKAVNRIVRQREDIISLLEKVSKVDVKKLLRYLDSSGFYYRPSSPIGHHNFPGGLAEHSLGVYRIVEEWNKMTPDERRNSELYKFILSDKLVNRDIFTETMNPDDMVIASICHDLCKAEYCYFDGRRIRCHHSGPNPNHNHSSLSKKRLKENGIDTPDCNELLLAVRTHMRLFSKSDNENEIQRQQEGKKSMLAIAVWAADKLDAKRHPAGRRHFDF